MLDFILFCKERQGEELNYQIFIEPKGGHLIGVDKWKEDFLKEIREQKKVLEIDSDRYLVHACLEGPEAGIYYRGKATITNDENIKIELPGYVKHIGTNFTINITKIFSGKKVVRDEKSRIDQFVQLLKSNDISAQDVGLSYVIFGKKGLSFVNNVLNLMYSFAL